MAINILLKFRHHRESVFAVDFGWKDTSSYGLFASGSKDGTIAIWDLYSDTIR
jgi:WD40 repeat protein